MAYTTPAKVVAILDHQCGIDLSPFIAAANNLVTNVCVPLSYDNGTLVTIETWLAAHFYTVLKPTISESEADSIARTYDTKVDLGLKVTKYGQQALLFDYKGGLARLNFEAMNKGKPKVTATWLGRKTCRVPPSGWPWGWFA